jgi:hypothetical protein
MSGKDWASIHPSIKLKDSHTRYWIARLYRSLNRSGSAPTGKKREMEVEKTITRNREQVFRQKNSVTDRYYAINVVETTLELL